MDMFYSIEIQDGITTIRFKRPPTISDFKSIIDELSQRDIYRRRLWNLTPHGLILSPSEREQIALYGKNKFTQPSRLAIVASDNLAYGICRAFEVYRGDDLANTSVFRTEEEALKWLSQND